MAKFVVRVRKMVPAEIEIPVEAEDWKAAEALVQKLHLLEGDDSAEIMWAEAREDDWSPV